MKVRKVNYLEDADILAYMEIRKKSLLEWEDYNLGRFPEEEADFSVEGYKMHKALQDFYFLEDDFGKVIGYVCINCKSENFLQFRHNFYIGPIYIDKDFRGKGFGKKILKDSILEIVKSKDYDFFRFELNVNVDSEIPKNLYKSLGFQEVGIVKNIFRKKDGTFGDCILMEYFYKKQKS